MRRAGRREREREREIIQAISSSRRGRSAREAHARTQRRKSGKRVEPPLLYSCLVSPTSSGCSFISLSCLARCRCCCSLLGRATLTAWRLTRALPPSSEATSQRPLILRHQRPADRTANGGAGGVAGTETSTAPCRCETTSWPTISCSRIRSRAPAIQISKTAHRESQRRFLPE